MKRILKCEVEYTLYDKNGKVVWHRTVGSPVLRYRDESEDGDFSETVPVTCGEDVEKYFPASTSKGFFSGREFVTIADRRYFIDELKSVTMTQRFFPFDKYSASLLSDRLPAEEYAAWMFDQYDAFRKNNPGTK